MLKYNLAIKTAEHLPRHYRLTDAPKSDFQALRNVKDSRFPLGRSEILKSRDRDTVSHMNSTSCLDKLPTHLI